MNPRWLECFVAVAQELNFGRAAERLGMAQPPLSRLIQQLEDDLGAQLFSRGRNQVRLTQAGERFLERASDILEQIEESSVEVRRIGQGREGRLRIGYVGSACYGTLPQIVKAYHNWAPAVSLGLFPMNNAALHSALIRRQIDIAIARPHLNDPEFFSRPLMEEPLVLAVPSGSPLAAQAEISLAHVGPTPLILYPEKPRPGYADQVLQLIPANHRAKVPRVFAMDNQTAISLVAAEMGVCVVPRSVSEAARDGVRFVPLSDSGAVTSLSLNIRADDQSVHVKKFVDIAQRTMRQMAVRA